MSAAAGATAQKLIAGRRPSATHVRAEIGIDMSRFPSAAHLISWACICHVTACPSWRKLTPRSTTRNDRRILRIGSTARHDRQLRRDGIKFFPWRRTGWAGGKTTGSVCADVPGMHLRTPQARAAAERGRILPHESPAAHGRGWVTEPCIVLV